MGGMGGGFGFSESKSSSRPRDITPEEFAALRPSIAAELRSFFGGGQGFPGPFAAQITPEEVSALGDVSRGALDFSPSFQSAQDALVGTARGDFLLPESNPFLRATIEAAQRPVLRAFDENELLERALFARAGQRLPESSPFARARAIATEGLINELGDISTVLAGGNFQAERQRQQEAAGALAQIDQQRFERTVQNLQVQALPRLIEDLGIERGREEFARRIDALTQILALATGASLQFGQFSSGKSRSINVSGNVG